VKGQRAESREKEIRLSGNQEVEIGISGYRVTKETSREKLEAKTLGSW
jgi:hypothetical protein